MNLLDDTRRALAPHGLVLRGALHDSGETVCLVGPDEPAFWPHFTSGPEYADGAPDPLDRWSKRVIGGVAGKLGARAAFPSDGPPYPPFIRWALDSGTCFLSPVGLLVHPDAGLFISFRGAIILPNELDLPGPLANPCKTCRDQPCRAACPVKALGPDGYDVPRCKSHVMSEATGDCRSGCLVRRACPVSQQLGRLPEQSAFHMAAFL